MINLDNEFEYADTNEKKINDPIVTSPINNVQADVLEVDVAGTSTSESPDSENSEASSFQAVMKTRNVTKKKTTKKAAKNTPSSNTKKSKGGEGVIKNCNRKIHGVAVTEKTIAPTSPLLSLTHPHPPPILPEVHIGPSPLHEYNWTTKYWSMVVLTLGNTSDSVLMIPLA